MEEDESDLIEKEHLMCFRGQQMQDTLENDVVAKTVDSKDGKDVHIQHIEVIISEKRKRAFHCLCVWLKKLPLPICLRVDTWLRIKQDAAVCKPNSFCDRMPAVKIRYE